MRKNGRKGTEMDGMGGKGEKNDRRCEKKGLRNRIKLEM